MSSAVPTSVKVASEDLSAGVDKAKSETVEDGKVAVSESVEGAKAAVADANPPGVPNAAPPVPPREGRPAAVEEPPAAVPTPEEAPVAVPPPPPTPVPEPEQAPAAVPEQPPAAAVSEEPEVPVAEVEQPPAAAATATEPTDAPIATIGPPGSVTRKGSQIASERQAAKAADYKLVKDYENSRAVFFERQQDSFRAYFAAMKVVLADSQAVVNHTIVYLRARVLAQRQAADTLSALHTKMPCNDLEDENPSRRALAHLASKDTVAGQEYHKFCLLTETAEIAPLQEMATETNEQAAKALLEGDRVMALQPSGDEFVSRAFEQVVDSVTYSHTTAREKSGSRDLDKAAYTDQWLAEHYYYASAEKQRRAWKSYTTIMNGLFAEIKEIVLRQRRTVQELLNSLLDSEQDTWTGIGALASPFRESLTKMELELEQLNAEVEKNIGKAPSGAAAGGGGHGQEEGGDSPVQSRAKLSPETVVQEVTNMPTPPHAGQMTKLSDMLNSPLLTKADLLEYKRGEVMANHDWIHGVGVITRDNWMHLFALPDDVSKEIGPALDRLTPPDIDVHSKFGKSNQAGVVLMPTWSLDLSRNSTKARSKDSEEHQRQFTITGAKKNTGLKSMFKTESARIMKVRVATPELMMEWVVQAMEISRETNFRRDSSDGGLVAEGSTESLNSA